MATTVPRAERGLLSGLFEAVFGRSECLEKLPVGDRPYVGAAGVS